MVTKEERDKEIAVLKRREEAALKEATRKALAHDLFKVDDILASANKVYAAVLPELEANVKFCRLSYLEMKQVLKDTQSLDPQDRGIAITAKMIEKANPELKGEVQDLLLNQFTSDQVALIIQRITEAAPPFLQPTSMRKPSNPAQRPRQSSA
jgi:hypothetical protein